MTVGYRVVVCDNMSFHGDFTPVLAKHSKNFNLVSSLSIGVDQCQRNFQPMVKSVDKWKASQLWDGKQNCSSIGHSLKAVWKRHLDRVVHRIYFNPTH